MANLPTDVEAEVASLDRKTQVCRYDSELGTVANLGVRGCQRKICTPDRSAGNVQADVDRRVPVSGRSATEFDIAVKGYHIEKAYVEISSYTVAAFYGISPGNILYSQFSRVAGERGFVPAAYWLWGSIGEFSKPRPIIVGNPLCKCLGIHLYLLLSPLA